MKIPANLKYSRTHEWVKIEGDKAYVGITDHAQHSMGDIVFAELPQAGKILKAGDPLGVVESVKAVSDVYTPISGKVVQANQELINAPEKINEDPYINWMILLEFSDKSETDRLLDKAQYEEICKED